jgi:hypothetical protein
VLTEIQTCDELSIPTHLRQNNRQEEPNFSGDLYLYRRFQPELKYEFEGHLSVAAISYHFKPPYNISVNRSSFCRNETDVLYDAEKLPHRFDWGVMRAFVASINGHIFKSVLGDNSTVVVKLEVKHSPLCCMYPHAEILIYKNDVPITKRINSEALKTDIQEELRHFFEVCHRPNPHHTPTNEPVESLTNTTWQKFTFYVKRWFQKIFEMSS